MSNNGGLVYGVVKQLARLLFRVLYRVEVRDDSGGVEHDKLIVVSNHQSFLDGALLGAFLPMAPMWTVHSQIWSKPLFRLLLSWLPVVVVDTNSPLAVKKLLGVVESGRYICMFPEGRITQTGSLMKIYDGPAYLAARAGAWVLPVRIDGAQATPLGRMGPWYPRRWFPKIRITILPARTLEMPEGRTPRERRRKATVELRHIMQDVLFRTERMTSLHEAVLDSMDFYGKETVVMQDIRLQPETYGHVLKAGLALGRLVSRLAKPGERVGVMMPNVTTTASLLFGMFGVRRIPAMINYTSGPEGVRSACELACIRVLLTSRAFVERAKLAPIIAALSSVEVVYLEDLRGKFTLLDKLWLMGYAIHFPRRVMKPAAPDEPAIVMFTSGSESKPKGVVLSHRSVLANVHQVKAIIPFDSRDHFLTALPVFHAFGLTAGLLLPLVCGCRIFFYPSPLHYRVIPEVVYDQDCTVLLGTPTFLANYAKTANSYDFFRIRYIVCGAERLPEETRRLWLDKFGIRLLEGYGATEYGPVIAAQSPFAYKVGTVGELLPGIEYKLEPVAGIEEGGILHVKGPNSMLGYLLHDQPGVLQPPSSPFGEGWYSTGDVVVMEEGFVRIAGRVKRFAKVAGEMVSLELVEKVALAASPGHIHASTTQSEGRRGETIVLFTTDADLRRDRLVSAAGNLGAPDFAIARRIVSVPKLPLLGNGKVDYVRLKSMASELAA
ncbi:MAG: AMP-binding protein [Bryobacteraceae bacterium]